jgi:hypothetical protein
MDETNKNVKFYAYAHDPTLADNNGGSLVLWHHLHAIEELGFISGGMIGLGEEVPSDADFVMFQGEWYDMIEKKLNKSKVKRICWIGHYDTSPKYSMPKLSNIKADFYHTQYKGEAVEWGKKQIGRDIYYLPHAGCKKCNTHGKIITEHTTFDGLGNKIKIPVSKKIIIRNRFNERKEDWLDYAGVEKRNAPFDEIKDIYKSSRVVANIHGDFQKGRIDDFFRIPAHMINERIFQVILSGGFAISDDTPIVREFFNEDEVPQCKTKQEFKEKIDYFVSNPEERISYMKKAKKRILDEHLYTHRIKNYLDVIL